MKREIANQSLKKLMKISKERRSLQRTWIFFLALKFPSCGWNGKKTEELNHTWVRSRTTTLAFSHPQDIHMQIEREENANLQPQNLFFFFFCYLFCVGNESIPSFLSYRSLASPHPELNISGSSSQMRISYSVENMERKSVKKERHWWVVNNWNRKRGS